MVHIENVSLSPAVRTAIQNFGSKVKRPVPQNPENKNQSSGKDDEFLHSDSEPVPADERTEAAVKKFNAANELKMVKETNYFAELDNDYKLLQEYKAYKTPVFNEESFKAVSEDTVSVSCNEKPAQVRFEQNEDGNKSYSITFNDDSQINYFLFSNGGKMKINGEEFEMPEGTIVETKSVKDRVFSQLIQTPQMSRNVVSLPEGLEKVEQLLQTSEPPKSDGEVEYPKPAYMLDLLGKPNSVRSLLNLSNHSSADVSKTMVDEANFLEKAVAEGKLPENTAISGVNKDGKRILTIPNDNCKYEVCGSEMRVIDNNGEIKMAARYESKREANGLWVVSYENGKPSSASHYASWNLDKPLSTVNYEYNNDNTIVTVTTSDAYGNKDSVRQTLPQDFCLAIDNGLKFVSPDKLHLGSEFEG